jgi:hypothetical protein
MQNEILAGILRRTFPFYGYKCNPYWHSSGDLGWICANIAGFYARVLSIRRQDHMAKPEGVEPPTNWLTASRSSVELRFNNAPALFVS